MTQNSIPSTKETNIDGMIVGFVIFLVLFTGVAVYKYNKSAVDIKIKRTLNKNAHVAILSTYGPSVSGSPFYEAYVAKAMKYILDPTNKVNELIIVGGYTVDANTSQSQAVLNYIKEKYPAFNTSSITVTLDECGITTWQNIKNAKKLMDKEGISAKKITIFAEESRRQKVNFFAYGVFLKEFDQVPMTDSILQQINQYKAASKEEWLTAYNSRDMLGLKSYSGDWSYVNNNRTRLDSIQVITLPSGLPQNFIDDEHIKLFSEAVEFLDPMQGNQAIKTKLADWTKTAGFNVAENLVQKGCSEYKQFLKK